MLMNASVNMKQNVLIIFAVDHKQASENLANKYSACYVWFKPLGPSTLEHGRSSRMQ